MKISYKHLIQNLESNPSIDEISERLFQLGHEHEICDEIFDIELTPNRGDCQSLNGILRDLNLFYEVKINTQIYDSEIPKFEFNFQNNAVDKCSHISFLKIEIDKHNQEYKDELKTYFDALKINKNNFFTDISNYISYETGQPTHCYDATKITQNVSLDFIETNEIFETVLGHKTQLRGKNLVFIDKNKIINLAGIMGGKETACSDSTTSVIVECANFNPEFIIGKSVQYNLKSEAAHKFERGVDPFCHDFILRRFLKIVENNAKIKKVEIFNKLYKKPESILIKYDNSQINKILGTDINDDEMQNYLFKLNLHIKNQFIVVPSYRNDLKTQNDIAEEIARAIGYNNIKKSELNMPCLNLSSEKVLEKGIKNFLISRGFFEVINFPFNSENLENSIRVDNPLDSNREFLRTSLKHSLLNNLIYNEKRQKDCIKLFEISDIYDSTCFEKARRKLGIISCGRIENNYLNFSKKIDQIFLNNTLKEIIVEGDFKIEQISRDNIGSKFKNDIFYAEIDLDEHKFSKSLNEQTNFSPDEFALYEPISEFPVSSRDLSYLIGDPTQFKTLEETILNFKNKLVKEIFIFDFYNNKDKNILKVAFRFIFQSNSKTVTDIEVNEVMDLIIKDSLKIPSIEIPGLKK